MTLPHIIQDLGYVIKRFKFKELEAAVLPHFPEITWNQVIEKLVLIHENLSIQNAVAIIQAELNRLKLSQKVLRKRLELLEVIDVSRNYYRKTWYAYLLKDPIKPMALSDEELKFSLKKEILILLSGVSINIVTCDDITYVYIKNKSKGLKQYVPNSLYVALCIGQKYFFCSNKMVTKQVLKVLTKTLGYSKCKPLKLIGHDLKSLMKILRTRIQNVSNIKDSKDAVYRKAPPIIKDTGLNFIQKAQRNAFAQKCFGKNPPILQTFSVNVSNLPWHNEEIESQLDEMNMKWEFRSPNLGNFMTKLMEHHVLIPPIPYYITNMMALGENAIALENDQSENLNDF